MESQLIEKKKIENFFFFMNIFYKDYTENPLSFYIFINPEEYAREVINSIYKKENTEGMTITIAMQTVISSTDELEYACGIVTNSWTEGNRQFEEGYIFVIRPENDTLTAWKVLTGPGVEEQDVYMDIDLVGSTAGTGGIYKVARVEQVGEQIAGFFKKDNKWYFQFPAKSAWIYGASLDMIKGLPENNLVEVISQPYVNRYEPE